MKSNKTAPTQKYRRKPDFASINRAKKQYPPTYAQVQEEVSLPNPRRKDFFI